MYFLLSVTFLIGQYMVKSEILRASMLITGALFAVADAVSGK